MLFWTGKKLCIAVALILFMRNFKIFIKCILGYAQEFAYVFAGFGDQESAAVIQPSQKKNFLALVHYGDRLADFLLRLLNEMLEQILNVVCEVLFALLFFAILFLVWRISVVLLQKVFHAQ